jgi:hypothetical protein
MPAVFSTIAYIVEANNTTSLTDNSIITRGIIVSNRPDKNNPVFINFISFGQSIVSDCIYFLNGKFVYNKRPNDGSQELQVKLFFVVKKK